MFVACWWKMKSYFVCNLCIYMCKVGLEIIWMFSYVGCWHLVKLLYKKDMVIKKFVWVILLWRYHLWQWFIFCLLANSPHEHHWWTIDILPKKKKKVKNDLSKEEMCILFDWVIQNGLSSLISTFLVLVTPLLQVHSRVSILVNITYI